MTQDRTSTNMREHEFTLIVDGVDDLTDEVVDAVYEAGCNDATVSLQRGYLHFSFTREADSIEDAIFSAMRDLKRTGLPLCIVRVERHTVVTASDIAKQIGRSRQAVHQYINNDCGPGGFPAPVSFVAERLAVWSWQEASGWLAEHEMVAKEEHQAAEVVDAINAELSRQRHTNPELMGRIAHNLRHLSDSSTLINMGIQKSESYKMVDYAFANGTHANTHFGEFSAAAVSPIGAMRA